MHEDTMVLAIYGREATFERVAGSSYMFDDLAMWHKVDTDTWHAMHWNVSCSDGVGVTPQEALDALAAKIRQAAEVYDSLRPTDPPPAFDVMPPLPGLVEADWLEPLELAT